MTRATYDDLLQELNIITDDKTTTNTKNPRSNPDPDDNWLATPRDTKKPATNPAAARHADYDDLDPELDDRWNQTGGSNPSYVPNFGGTGTLTNTFSTQGQDTIQRIVSQPRPTTSSGSQNYNDLFGTSPPKTTAMGDIDKTKKAVRFEDVTTTRPSTAPSPSDIFQTRPNTGALSAMRTGVEPNKSFDMFGSSKGTAQSANAKNWLGMNETSSEDDEFPLRPTQKIESAVTTLAKRTPLASVAEVLPAPVEQPKKSKLDDYLDDDRRALTSKTVLPPTTTSTKALQNFLFDDRATPEKRLPTATTPKTASLTETPIVKPTTKSLFDTSSDFGNFTFKNATKDSTFDIEPQISAAAARGGSSTVNLDMKRLEFENNELRMTLEHIKRQHEVERSMLEESHKHRLEYIEKSLERKESRLKEENEHLLRQLNDRTQQFESEKSALIMDHQRRLDDLQRDRTTEMENLRSLQRQTLDHLRREHEQAIQRLKQLKQEEISTALDVTTHTRAFESVVDHMEQNAKNIDELRLKIEAKHSSVLSEKEIEARAKEQQLKAYEGRLHIQAGDFERERKNLQELISRLEVHLSEQTKLVEEERWKAMQAQKRMEAMQDALNGEQRLFTEKIARDRAEIQRGKDQLLDDQKVALATIYESRTQLADERAKVEATQKVFQEQKQREMLQAASIEAEARAQQKLAAEQMARLDKREQEVMKREEALIMERRAMAELKQRLDIEQSTVKSAHEETKQKLIDIEHANDAIKKEKERLSQLYYELHALDGKNTGRLQQLQQSIQTLRQQEEHMSEQYSRMADERPPRNHLRSSVTLKSQSPMRDSGFSTMQLPLATPLLSTISPQQSVEDSAMLRSFRMNALQDQLYIQDEMSFLSSLRTGNPLLARSGTSNSTLYRHADSNLLRTNH